MSNLRIYVDVNTTNNTTYSSFGVDKANKVFFNNIHSTDTLTVVVKDATTTSSPLCDNGKNGPKVPTFAVGPGGHEAYSICADFQGKSFKYDATIGNAATEDPIVIIEKSGYDPGATNGTLAIVAGVSLLLGALGVLGYQKLRGKARQG